MILVLRHTHTQIHTVDLQMEKNNSDEGPLWSFVDDVCVGKPVAVRKKKNPQ